ncbi:flagellar hook-length control protein FliK [Natronocella acetinitrilica]|uniref:Flagellar hook-length control protein FliK n=1 Tax=Natronocella acetinitrilica TaxID=414046 RepID=A0AAE3G4E3_9GAMM|nr:flagellar hook-length control protein FliK [Natronocella acetinitrilica]MCP1675600.1 flagellar hook-length control protein FliK [Natronocella acetinitrilica]
MNGLNLLQTLFAGQMDGERGLKSLQDPENIAFMEALLETDALQGSGLTLDDLKAWLAGEGGKGLPLPAAFLQAGDGSGPESPIIPANAELDADPAAAPVELRADLSALGQKAGLDAALPANARSSAELSGQQLAARLAVLEQLQSRRQDGEAPVRSAPRVDVEGLQGLQSYAQTSQLVDQGSRAAPLPTFIVGTPMDQSGWGQALGERLVMLAKDGLQQARLQINPRELGPVEVNISMKDDKTTIHFLAQHAVTRDALEAELPRLRVMMQENGFEHLDVNVGRDDGRGLAERDGDERRNGDGSAGGGEAAATGENPENRSRPLGLIDQYA